MAQSVKRLTDWSYARLKGGIGGISLGGEQWCLANADEVLGRLDELHGTITARQDKC